MAGNENSGQRGSERDPEKTCKGNGGACQAWPVRGLDVCKSHGGGTSASLAKSAEIVAGREAAALATAAGMEVPTALTAKDFPLVVAEYVARFNRWYARLERELDAKRTADNEIDLAREYGDIFDRQATAATLVTKMMDAAARLGIRVEEDPDDDPSVTGTGKLLAALDDLRRSRDETMTPCEACSGSGYLPRWDFSTPPSAAG